MNKLRIGLMGCGVVAGCGHLPALRESPNFELAAIYDPDAKKGIADKGTLREPTPHSREHCERVKRVISRRDLMG